MKNNTYHLKRQLKASICGAITKKFTKILNTVFYCHAGHTINFLKVPATFFSSSSFEGIRMVWTGNVIAITDHPAKQKYSKHIDNCRHVNCATACSMHGGALHPIVLKLSPKPDFFQLTANSHAGRPRDFHFPIPPLNKNMSKNLH